MKYKFIHEEKIHTIMLEKKEEFFKVAIDHDKSYEITDFTAQNNILSFKLDDTLIHVYFAEDNDKKYLSIDGNYFILESEKKKATSVRESVSLKGNSVASPMPGLVVKIPVTLGDKVKADTTLAIVEAMKMQNELRAPCDGVISKINFKEGDQVDALQVIVELET
jgi:biotin carboxyl carrier protein